MNATVKAQQFTTVYDTTQYYITIETPKGKVIVSIGEKNYEKLRLILGESIEQPATHKKDNHDLKTEKLK